MAFEVRNPEKAKGLHDYRVQHEAVGGLCSLGRISPSSHREQERRIRREIANSNERRRMQSINSGFQSLKTLLPHADGEKLSKAAILQQTSEFIFNLEQEKTRLLQQNTQMRQMLAKRSAETKESPPKRRKNEDSISSDEGIGSPEVEDLSMEELQKEMVELRQQLDRERRLRMLLEERNRSLEAQLYPEKLREIAKHEQQKQLLDVQRMHEIQQMQQTQTVVPVPVQLIHAPPVITANNAARQNLDAIVQAIKHLEGAKATPTPEDNEKALNSDCDSVMSEKENSTVVVNDIEEAPITEVQTEEVISTTADITHQAVTVELVHPSFHKPQELTSTPGIFVS
ncbi:transcription factor AP-4-like [Saccoglossus kowalevskii]|uniref:Transcription factor AP-4-like n=1 Tax=Saccoglossus kowalevskii TaxID=10224 RepID=A0ABM0GWC4_SACKO|nr:PREDICTED: transcription factor AP-4-like [Saccoglossus kowalevskii]